MFRLDSPRSGTRVLREVTRTKRAEDAESKIAFRFVNENDSKKISTGALFAKQSELPLLTQSNVSVIPVNTKVVAKKKKSVSAKKRKYKRKTS